MEGNDGGIAREEDGQDIDDVDGDPATMGAPSASVLAIPGATAAIPEHTRSHAARKVLRIFIVKTKLKINAKSVCRDVQIVSSKNNGRTQTR